jgi:type IV pilus assembly protein PilP
MNNCNWLHAIIRFPSLRYLSLANLALVLTLAGCDTQNNAKMRDAQKFVDEVKAIPAPPVEPLPQFANTKTLPNIADITRNPFQPPLNTKNMQPDTNHVKGPLEAFPLDQLQYVGLISQQQRMWALVNAPNGTVYKITTGDYLGQNYGKVTAVTPTKILIQELIPDGMGGWASQENSLSLTTVKQDGTP